MKSYVRVALVGLSVCAARLSPAFAQAPAVKAAGELLEGQCTVTLGFSDAMPPNGVVQLSINKMPLDQHKVAGLRETTIRLKGPLGEGDEVSARVIFPPAAAGPWTLLGPVAGSANPPCGRVESVESYGDGREPFEASAYVGYAIDNFAPGSVGSYPPSQAGGVTKRRDVEGVDFDFRAVGSSSSERQLWIFGETLHGLRNADLNCKGDDAPPVCGNALSRAATDPTAASKQALFILENASSMEAFLGAWIELLTLQPSTTFPAKLYATVQFGYMMLDGEIRPDGRPLEVRRAYAAHHLGAGLLTPSGPFQGTFLELGWGRTDLLNADVNKPQWNRFKVDGHLRFPLALPFANRAMVWRNGPRVFIQLFGDFDLSHKTSDSVQTFIGLDFDPKDIFSW
jgi:hypothetical protein